jgi:hypothetical protein
MAKKVAPKPAPKVVTLKKAPKAAEEIDLDLTPEQEAELTRRAIERGKRERGS